MNTNILEKAKRFIKWNLDRNVQLYLRSKYDWKVSRAVSQGAEMSQDDIVFRELVLKDYNNRLALVESATTMEELNAIRITFYAG